MFSLPTRLAEASINGKYNANEIFEIWNGPVLSKYRRRLLNGDRSLNPCNQCNADGMVYGENHFSAWQAKN